MVAHINQAKAADGIICDLCGSVHIKKFEYFSVVFDAIEVDCDVKKAGPENIDKRYLDLDICTECMNDIKKRVIDGINKREKLGSWNAEG